MTRQQDVRVRRVYEEPSQDDGKRILVDRPWPPASTTDVDASRRARAHPGDHDRHRAWLASSRPRSRMPTGRSSAPKTSPPRPARSWRRSSTPASVKCPPGYGTAYPSAMKCLTTDREGLTAYLRFPAERHNRVRHSNFIERTFGETRRRVKVIGRLPGETSCLTLVWAVLDRAAG